MLSQAIQFLSKSWDPFGALMTTGSPNVRAPSVDRLTKTVLRFAGSEATESLDEPGFMLRVVGDDRVRRSLPRARTAPNQARGRRRGIVL